MYRSREVRVLGNANRGHRLPSSTARWDAQIRANVKEPVLRAILLHWLHHTDLTLNEYAYQVGMSQSHLTNIVSGKKSCSISVAVALANAVGLHVSALPKQTTLL